MSVITTRTSTVASSEAVAYDCTLSNLWTNATHPIDYPTQDPYKAHYSSIVVASHSTNYQMWSDGGMASAGVQSVAEIGADATIQSELTTAGKDVLDWKVASTTSAKSFSQMIMYLSMDEAHPYISTITMVAPSPDWFIGFYDFNAIDPNSSTWYEYFELESYPWDAGTDSGTTYLAADEAMNPQVPVFELTNSSVPSTGVLLNSDNTTVLPMATWECTLQSAPDTSAGAHIGVTPMRWTSIVASAMLSYFGN